MVELDSVTAAMAKYWLTDCQCRVIEECVQLHGGYGYMQDFADSAACGPTAACSASTEAPATLACRFQDGTARNTLSGLKLIVPTGRVDRTQIRISQGDILSWRKGMNSCKGCMA